MKLIIPTSRYLLKKMLIINQFGALLSLMPLIHGRSELINQSNQMCK
jgi:hypothetical protein